MATSPGRARSRDRDDDPPPAVRLSAVTLGIPFFTHLLGLAATWAALKQLQILWICDEVLGPEVPEPGLPVNVTGAPIRLLDRCDAPEVQATASAWFTALSLCYNVPSLVLVPIFGYFLDRWSRKRIILVAMSFSIIHTFSMLLITKYHLILAQGSQLLPALMAATLVHGMGGGRHVVVMSIFALVADVTTKKERTTYIARFESIILSAFTVGPLLGGIMVKAFDSNIPPLYLSIILDAFTIGWFIFVVPETMRNKEEGTEDYERLPDSEVAEDNVAAIVAQGSVIPEEAWNAETHKDEAAQPKPKRSRLASLHRSIFHSHNRNRSLLVLILLVLNLVSNGLMFFFVLYTRAHFGWKAFEDGIYSFLTSSSRIVSLSLVLPYVLMRLQGAGVSGHEVWIVRFGLAMYVLALYLYGTVETGWGFLLVSSLIDSFGSSLAGPTMRSLVSTSTHASKQGRVLSVVAFVEAVAALVSPLFFGPLYAALVKVGQEHWGFWICACGCGLAWMLSLAMRTSGAIKISDESVPEAGRSSEERETRDSGRE